MLDNTTPPSDGLALVLRCEPHVRQVNHIAELLAHLAESPSQLDPAALMPLAGLLADAGTNLHRAHQAMSSGSDLDG